MNKLTYLATPYTHPNPDVSIARFRLVNKVAGDLMRMGHIVFSPISMSHPIAMESGLPTDWDFWKDFDVAYIECSCQMIVLCLEGWEESTGVQAEIEIATRIGIPISYIREGDEMWPV